MPFPWRDPMPLPLPRPSNDGARWTGQAGVAAAGTGDETARHIAEVTAALAEVARISRLDVLAYLLEIAQLEANRAATSLASDHR